MNMPKVEAQLKSCRFQFKKMTDNNRILCEALNTAEDALLLYQHSPMIKIINFEEINSWPALEAIEKIKELKEKLK